MSLGKADIGLIIIFLGLLGLAIANIYEFIKNKKELREHEGRRRERNRLY